MKALVQGSRYIVLIGVVATLAAALADFIWGAVMAATLIWRMVTRANLEHPIGVDFIQLMDTFLIATGLLVFGIGLYELFVGDLELPGWLKINNLQELKARLSNIVVLVMAVAFLEHLVEDRNPMDTLFMGAAVALVSGALVAFVRLSGD